MSALVPALIASTLLAIATVPITTLSLQSTRTRVSSQLFHEAEALALGVRKEAALAGTLEITADGTLLLDGTAAQLDENCTVGPTPYVEREDSANTEIAKVTCTMRRGSLTQRNTQPLFSYSALQTSYAEKLAEDVREQVKEADKARIINGDLQIYSSGSWRAISLSSVCSVSMETVAGNLSIPVVTCSSGSGSSRESFTQLLFSKENLILSDNQSSDASGSPGFCYSRYRSQNASNQDERLYTAQITVEDFNNFLREPGNSEGFLQVHPITDAGCQQAINSGNNLPSDSDEDHDDDDNDDDHDRSDRCVVRNYIGDIFENDPDDQRWNTRDDGEFKSRQWNRNRKAVISQDPAPNTSYDCDDDVELEFRA